MVRAKYRTVSIQEEVLHRIRRLISRRSDLGYSSVAEFIKDAVRRRLEEIESTEKLSFRKEAD